MIKSIETFVHVLRISIGIILLIIGIPALFFNEILFAGIITIILAVIIIPKVKIPSKYLNISPLFQFFGAYLIIDWLFDRSEK